MSILNIRKGIFETNSSSVHTLCITKCEIDVPSSFTFSWGGQFGWENDTYSSPYDKSEYFYQILKDVVSDEARRRFKLTDEFINNKETYEKDQYWFWYPEKHPEYKKFMDDVEAEYRLQVEDILNKYGCYDVTWEEENDKRYVYIDHIDEAQGFFNDMMNNPELLIHFLFGNSCIYTGNDNDEYDYPDKDENVDYCYIKGN